MRETLSSSRLASTSRVPFLLGGAVLMLLFSVALSTLTYVNFRSMAEANRWNIHTYKVLEQVSKLRMGLGGEESRLRGFAITRDLEFLKSAHESEQMGLSSLQTLHGLVSDRLSQQHRLNIFERDYANWRRTYASGNGLNSTALALHLSTDTAPRRIALTRLQAQLDVFETVERRLLAERAQAQEVSQQKTSRSLLLGSAITILIAGFLTVMLGWQTRALALFNSQLQSSQSQLNIILDNAPIVLYAIDESERFTVFAGKGVPSLQLGDGQVIGKTLTEVMGENYEALSAVRAALNGQPSVSRSTVKDHVFETYRQPLFDDSARSRGMIGVGLDVTERHRAEEARRASDERYRMVVAGVQEIIFQLDAQGRWTFLNPAWTTLLGYDVESSLGLSYIDFLGPDERDRAVDLFQSLPDPERRVRQYEVQFQAKDGRICWLDAQVRIQYDDGNQFVGITGTFNDVTERKRAEAALLATTALQRAILDGASYSIIATNPDGIITSFNRAAERMLGYLSADVCGKESPVIFHDLRETEIRARQLTEELGRPVEPGFEAFVAKSRDGITDEAEWTYVRRDGSRFPVRLSISALRGEHREITGYVGIGYDLSDNRRAERLKNEFVSVVSHELRTPLTSIRGALGLLVGGVAGELPSGAQQMLEIAQKNSDRLVLLINDILDIEKIESGKMRFDLKKLRVGDLLKSALEFNEAYAEVLGVELKLEEGFERSRAAGLAFIGDEGRIQQVLSNLLSNAAKFTPSGGIVHVGATTLQRDGQPWLHVFVRDQGPGAPEEFVPRLFEKFAQADSSSTRKKGGTGLGLAIARAIVEKHGGYIGYLPPEKEDSGSTFYFEVPVDGSYEDESPRFDPVDNAVPRILVCEDDLGVATILADLIRQNGYEVDIAKSCAEARALLRARNYQGMTLEMVLSDGDGLEFLAELRAHERARLLPVVVISAYSAAGDIYGEAFGVIDWLCKPLDSNRLLAAISRFAEGRQACVLHIEDDEDVRRVTAAIIGDSARVVAAASLREARGLLETQHFDLAILDIGLPDGSGFDLVPLLSNCKPPIPIVLYSATEVSSEQARLVTASLVKSRTDNEALHDTIQRFLPIHRK